MKKAIVTGACGFIGSRLTARLLESGYQVYGIDNLSRKGTEIHERQLSENDKFSFYKVDVTDADSLNKLFEEIGPVDAVFHMAAQVAVTASYIDRRNDFMNNACGSFNVIEAAKVYTPDAWCLYSSTNKVYGHITVSEPVGMNYPLKPYTMYGVSKATGELYFSEYGTKELGMKTCSLRQSCIYGPHQFGVEDQGWVAWFAIANLMGNPITIYGDGEQIRDLLYIEDLIDLYMECMEKQVTGIYPVGGGASNAMSVKEAIDFIPTLTGKDFPSIDYGETRPGDQPFFIADLSWSSDINLEWTPKIDVKTGLKQMIDWLIENEETIRSIQK